MKRICQIIAITFLSSFALHAQESDTERKKQKLGDRINAWGKRMEEQASLNSTGGIKPSTLNVNVIAAKYLDEGKTFYSYGGVDYSVEILSTNQFDVEGNELLNVRLTQKHPNHERARITSSSCWASDQFNIPEMHDSSILVPAFPLYPLEYAWMDAVMPYARGLSKDFRKRRMGIDWFHGRFQLPAIRNTGFVSRPSSSSAGGYMTDTYYSPTRGSNSVGCNWVMKYFQIGALGEEEIHKQWDIADEYLTKKLQEAVSVSYDEEILKLDGKTIYYHFYDIHRDPRNNKPELCFSPYMVDAFRLTVIKDNNGKPLKLRCLFTFRDGTFREMPELEMEIERNADGYFFIPETPSIGEFHLPTPGGALLPFDGSLFVGFFRSTDSGKGKVSTFGVSGVMSASKHSMIHLNTLKYGKIFPYKETQYANPRHKIDETFQDYWTEKHNALSYDFMKDKSIMNLYLVEYARTIQD